MGFFENLARSAEVKAREEMFTALTGLKSGATWGGVELPCHIIDETHHGLFLLKGQTVLVAFPCQGVWWGYQITPDLLEKLNGPYGEALVFPMFGSLLSPERLAPYPGVGAVPTSAAFVYALDQVESERRASES